MQDSRDRTDASADSGADQQPALRRELGLRDLVLFSIAGLIGTRWLAAAAHTGPGSVSLWILAVIFFLVPSAICMARLSAIYPEEGGLYVWTKASFGEWHGFLCFWFYWTGLAFWFPSFLMAVTSMASYAFAPQLAEDRWYVLPASMLLLWIAVGSNLIGLKVGKWLDNIGGLASYGLGVLLIVLAAIMFLRHGSATPLHIWPKWDWHRLNFWSQIAYGITGLELAPVLGGEIQNPRRNLPLASYIAGSTGGRMVCGRHGGAAGHSAADKDQPAEWNHAGGGCGWEQFWSALAHSAGGLDDRAGRPGTVECAGQCWRACRLSSALTRTCRRRWRRSIHAGTRRMSPFYFLACLPHSFWSLRNSGDGPRRLPDDHRLDGHGRLHPIYLHLFKCMEVWRPGQRDLWPCRDCHRARHRAGSNSRGACLAV